MVPTFSCSYSFDPWYVVHCKPSLECSTAHLLKERFGLFSYVPEIRVCAEKTHMKVVPFFPGYFFLQVNLQQTLLSSINTSPGVRRVVTFGESPEPIPSTIVDAIYASINELNNGGQFLFYDFSIGDTLRMKSGPFQDLELIFAGPMHPSQRVFVLLNMLGQVRKVQVERSKLEHTIPPPFLERKRYTRGKGRKIHP